MLQITFASFLVFLQVFLLSDPCAAECMATTRNACLNETCCGGGIGATCQFSTADGMCTCPSSACCPRDCRVNAFTPWSPCSPSCGDNTTISTRTRTRTAVVTAACGGAACPVLQQTNQCNVPCCPRNCTVGQWSSWSDCSVECGNGTRSRRRPKRTGEVCGGMCLARLFQSATCVGEGKVACEWAPFSAWSECSVTCGIGTRHRQRVKQRANDCDGECHGLSAGTASCVMPHCEGDCELNQWSEWAPCSAVCGEAADGVRTRNRTFVKSLTYTASVGCHAIMQEQDSCVCIAINSSGDSSSSSLSSSSSSSSSLALRLGLGITAAVLFVFAVVVAVFVIRRRKQAATGDMPASPRQQYAGIRFDTTNE